jgi:RimJ/RimL family protein N-acetyltransferase
MVELARAIPVARLTALCHPGHRASWRVLEKCGFTRRTDRSQLVELPNLEPGRPQPVLLYEILLSDD